MGDGLLSEVLIRERQSNLVPGVGDVIDGRYELLRDLGRGGAGAVFEARHVYTRRIVAMKLIREDRHGATLAELKARLIREAHALAAARSPGIVDVLDAGVAATGMPFLVLERLEGRTLEGLLVARERLPATETVAIGLQIAAALAVVHRAEVVHRDVKPSNVFVTRSAEGREHIKLVDFGIARLDRPGERKISLVGAFVGTPEYMSPEQLLARSDVDLRSDVYALGVTLFECLTGKVPYSGSYAQILLQSASLEPTPSVRSAGAEIPDRLAAVIDQALRKPREQRFPDMDAFTAALSAALPEARPQTALLAPPAARVSLRAAPVTITEATQQELDPSQRRRAPRAAYVTPVRILVDGKPVDGRSEDISEGGMLVMCRGECPVNRPISVRFASPIDGKVITVDGRVRWIKGVGRYDQAQRALGVEFESLPDHVRTSINRYAEMMEDPNNRRDTLV